MQQKPRKPRHSLICFLLFYCLTAGFCSAFAQVTQLDKAHDLQSESRLAYQKKGPLIILFSRQDCKFCEIVRRDHLKPLLQDPRYKNRIVIRQIDQDSGMPLTDFNGRSSTHATFVRQEKIGFVPVVAFYGPGGEPLATPIVGLRLPDFYQGYLEDAIDKSAEMLGAIGRDLSRSR